MEPNTNHPTARRSLTPRVLRLSVVAVVLAAAISAMARPSAARAGPAVASTDPGAVSTYWVAPGGTGKTCTERRPCGYVNDAYGFVRSGDTIKLYPGTHPLQSIPARPAGGRLVSPVNVTIEPAHVGADVRFAESLHVRVPNLTIRGMRGGTFVFHETADDSVFERSIMVEGAGHVRVKDADRVTVRGNRIIGGVDEDSLQVAGGTGHLIERNVLGGVGLSDPSKGVHGPHTDSVQILGGVDITVRRNLIYGSANQSFFARPDHAPIENLVVEDNTILRCDRAKVVCAPHFSLHVMASGPDRVPSVSGVTLRGNTVTGSALVRTEVDGLEAVGNVFETLDLDLDNEASTPDGCPIDFGFVEENFIGSTNCAALSEANTIE